MTVCSSPSLAQQAAEKAALAQALFDEGWRLVDASFPAAACPKFAASQKLDPGMGTKFRLAECYEKIGKTASAWALFLEIGDEARAIKRPEREEIARKRAVVLAPSLARMTIVVSLASANLPGLEVRREGIALDKAVWEVSLPVDPGEHFLTATAPGRLTWESEPVVARPSRTVEVTIPALEAQQGQSGLKPLKPELAADEKRIVAPAVLLGGVAIVALGVGGALFGVSKGKESDAYAMADDLTAAGKHCPSTLAKNRDPGCLAVLNGLGSADTLHNAAIGMFIGGGAVGVAAVSYFIWSIPAVKKTSEIDMQAAPMVGAGHGGIVFSGAF